MESAGINVPAGMIVQRTCGNPLCVALPHLYAVAAPVPHRHGGARSKLSWQDRLAIQGSELSTRALAAQYGVSQSTIQRAKTKL